jgi:hypothetical protein
MLPIIIIFAIFICICYQFIYEGFSSIKNDIKENGFDKEEFKSGLGGCLNIFKPLLIAGVLIILFCALLKN